MGLIFIVFVLLFGACQILQCIFCSDPYSNEGLDESLLSNDGLPLISPDHVGLLEKAGAKVEMFFSNVSSHNTARQ